MPDEPACRFTCPIGPSVNNLFLNAANQIGGNRVHNGRIRGPEYRRWLHDAGWEVRAQQPAAVSGIVRVLIEAPLNRRRDLDNALKAILDLIVSLRLIENDNWIDDLRIVRAGTGDKMTISIWPLDSPP